MTLHLKERMVEENPAALRLPGGVLGGLHVGQLDEDRVQRPGDHHEDRHDEKHCAIPHPVCLSIAEINDTLEKQIIRGLRVIHNMLECATRARMCQIMMRQCVCSCLSQGWVCRHLCPYLSCFYYLVCSQDILNVTCMCILWGQALKL